jgi:hypothetical protein
LALVAVWVFAFESNLIDDLDLISVFAVALRLSFKFANDFKSVNLKYNL